MFRFFYFSERLDNVWIYVQLQLFHPFLLKGHSTAFTLQRSINYEQYSAVNAVVHFIMFLQSETTALMTSTGSLLGLGTANIKYNACVTDWGVKVLRKF